MGTTTLSRSALLSNVAKSDTLGADGDFSFSISDLLANDANSVKAASFFFGSGHDGDTAALQDAYLLAHGITCNHDGTYTLTSDAIDFQYTVRAGTNGTYSTADVDVTAPVPVSHVGASLFSEDFNTYPTDPIGGTANAVDLRTGIDPDTGQGTADPNGWLDHNNVLNQAIVQLVHDDIGVSSAPGASEDYWLNPSPAVIDGLKQASKKGGFDLTHTFTDSNGGQDQVSFDLATFNFTRPDARDNGFTYHYATQSTDTFDFMIDGVSVYHTTAQQIHDAVGDNTMMRVNLFLDVGAGDHTLELVYTPDQTAGPAPAEPPAGAPIEARIGIGVDSIHIHDWIV